MTAAAAIGAFAQVQRPGQGGHPLLVGEGDEVVAGRLGHRLLALADDRLADAVDHQQADGEGGDRHGQHDHDHRAGAQPGPLVTLAHGSRDSR